MTGYKEEMKSGLRKARNVSATGVERKPKRNFRRQDQKSTAGEDLPVIRTSDELEKNLRSEEQRNGKTHSGKKGQQS